MHRTVCNLLLMSLVALAFAEREPHAQTLLNVSSLPSTHHKPMHANESRSTFLWSNSVYDRVNGASLALKLVHRDSPLSPLRDPQASPRTLLSNRLARDMARVRALSARTRSWKSRWSPSSSRLPKKHKISSLEEESPGPTLIAPLMSGLQQGSGEYFTRLGVGTPSTENYIVIDTGSDVTWIQCAPCDVCYYQTDPIFEPSLSSSYRGVACASQVCSMLDSKQCGAAGRDDCEYEAVYGDGSFSGGALAIETVTFNGVTVENVVMGCGHENEGLFAGAAGIFGLGGGSLSFPSQTGAHFGNIFSYCLVQRDKEDYSSITFGHVELPSGTQFTALLRNPYLATFYYVPLVGISVGETMLTIPKEAFMMDHNGYGGVILDSGTSVTRLVEAAYKPLRNAFRTAMGDTPFVGRFSLFDTCYHLPRGENVNVPSISLHFEGDAKMALPTSNYIIPVDWRGTYCLAFASTSEGLSIIGNIQQQSFLLMFDAVSSRMGFAPNEC